MRPAAQSLNYPGILAAPVVATASLEPDPIAIAPSDEPVAVVLDLGTHAEPLGGFSDGVGRQEARSWGGYEFSHQQRTCGSIETRPVGTDRRVSELPALPLGLGGVA